MANKRVSELAPITSPVGADLLFISDVSAYESKKLTLQDLSTYLLLNPGVLANITGSIFGTASFALLAVSASYANIQSASYALTASHALNMLASIISCSWASQSLSSSFATSASFVQLSNTDSASIATIANSANTSSYLYYVGANNGTASFAITAQNTLNTLSAISSSYALLSDFARSASYSPVADSTQSSSYSSYADVAGTAIIGITSNIVTSASWASASLTTIAADSANHAISADTASYSLPDINLIYPKGIYLAITQSNNIGQLDMVTIDPTSNQLATSLVEAIGTVIAYYTSSIILNETVGLYVLDRKTGISTLLDSTPIYINIQGQYGNISASIVAEASGSISGSLIGDFTGSISGSSAIGTITGSVSSSYNGFITGSISGSISTILAGSIKMPYSLMGQIDLSGSYLMYVSASSNITLESTRKTKFSINSTYGDFSVASAPQIEFYTDNTSSLLSFISSSSPSIYVGSASQVVAAGDSNIVYLQITSSTTGNPHYLWLLTSLINLDCNGNENITDIGGMPQSIVTMSLGGCNLTSLTSLSNTSASILDVSNNQLSAINFLAPSMSYLDISGNPFFNFPTIMPHGLINLNCNNTTITTVPGLLDLPDSIISMSFNSNPFMSSWLSALPTSLEWFSCNGNSSLPSLPTIPTSIKYLDVSNCSMNDSTIFNICSQLVTNAQLNGYLNIAGYIPPLLSATSAKLSTLATNGWTIITV